MLNVLTRLDNFLGIALRWFCIASTVMLSVVLSGVVFIRFVPIAKLSWSDEAVEWAFAWLVFMGAAALWRKREHFCVEALADRLEHRALGLYHRLFVELVSALFFIIFTYYSFQLTISANDRSPILEWPRPLWYACMPIAGAIMSGYSLKGIIRILVAFYNPKVTCPADLVRENVE
jgi:TRAP-type transport system small permease protein